MHCVIYDSLKKILKSIDTLITDPSFEVSMELHSLAFNVIENEEFNMTYAKALTKSYYILLANKIHEQEMVSFLCN